MSGHSKWATIRHKKGAADAKRGKTFSKLSKMISVAVKEGGEDPDMNFALRLAVDKAKAANMPKDNIERAIDRGAGRSGGDVLSTVVYEGMGPGGVALVIEAVTDNTNRTIANVKTILNKRGANPEAKVLWQFDQKAVVRVEDASAIAGNDDVELSFIDAGAEDLDWDGQALQLIGDRAALQALEQAAKDAGLEVENAGLAYVAKDTISLASEDEEKLIDLIDALEEDDDVNSVYTNAA